MRVSLTEPRFYTKRATKPLTIKHRPSRSRGTGAKADITEFFSAIKSIRAITRKIDKLGKVAQHERYCQYCGMVLAPEKSITKIDLFVDSDTGKLVPLERQISGCICKRSVRARDKSKRL